VEVGRLHLVREATCGDVGGWGVVACGDGVGLSRAGQGRLWSQRGEDWSGY
jgi:hypothetical protein